MPSPLKGRKLNAEQRQHIKDGIAKAKRKKHAMVPFAPTQHGEIPLDIIPDEERTQSRTVVVKPKISMEQPLIGLAHRLLDTQDRLMTMVETLQNQPKKKKYGPYKKKEKTKVKA